MTRELEQLRLLSTAAREQRARLRARLGATRSRIAPARLKEDVRIKAEAAVTDAARGVSDSVKRHPLAAGLAVAGAVAWAFRDPLLTHGPAWLKNAYDRLAGHLRFSEGTAGEDRAAGETDGGDMQFDDQEVADNDNDGSGDRAPQQEDTPRHD